MKAANRTLRLRMCGAGGRKPNEFAVFNVAGTSGATRGDTNGPQFPFPLACRSTL